MLKGIGNFFVRYFKRNPALAVLAGLTLVGIIVSMCVCVKEPADAILTLPLFVSIVVMLLQAEANRYGFLLGSINSLFYAAVYVVFTLYSSSLSAACISFPVQLLTFFRWNRKKYQNTTIFKKLSWLRRCLVAAGMVVAVLLLNGAMGGLESEFILLDNISNVFGFATYILCYLSYVEYPILTLVGVTIGTVNYIVMLPSDPAILPFLVYSVYNIICCTVSWVSVTRYYREQQAGVEK